MLNYHNNTAPIVYVISAFYNTCPSASSVSLGTQEWKNGLRFVVFQPLISGTPVGCKMMHLLFCSHTHTHTYARMHTHTCTHTCTHTHARTCTRTRTHTDNHTHTNSVVAKASLLWSVNISLTHSMTERTKSACVYCVETTVEKQWVRSVSTGWNICKQIHTVLLSLNERIPTS